MREQMAHTVVTGGERFTRSLEAAYRKMWARYCEKEYEPTGSKEVGEE